MEAADLMIGDLVCVTKNFTQKYHKIRALSNDEEDVLKGTYINDYGVECNSIFSRNDIQPIPLTTEILEKNGFVKESERCWVLGDEYSGDEVLVLYEVANGFAIPTPGLTIGFQNVHELQHLFKLCGITKEIEL